MKSFLLPLLSLYDAMMLECVCGSQTRLHCTSRCENVHLLEFHGKNVAFYKRIQSKINKLRALQLALMLTRKQVDGN